MPHPWLKTLMQDSAVDSICFALASDRRIEVSGACGSSGHLLAGLIQKRTKRPILLLTAHLDDTDEALDDLALLDGLTCQTFNALEVMPGESNVSLELFADRLAVVSQLRKQQQADVLIAPIQALMQAVPTDEAMDHLVMQIDRGHSLDQQGLIDWLVDAGYERADAIDQAGDFSVRGGIMDVFAPGDVGAIRIDFFGDEVDQISEIDVESLRSDRMLDSVRLIGASMEVACDVDQTTSFWSLLADDTIVMIHETLEAAEQGRGYYQRITDDRGIYSPHAVFKGLAKWQIIEVNQFAQTGTEQTQVILPVQSLPNFANEASQAVDELCELTVNKETGEVHRVIVFCHKHAERKRLEQLLAEADSCGQEIELAVAELYRGFIWGDLVLVPNHELFHRYQVKRRIRGIKTGTATEAFFDLDVGDYVVHVDHGIARFKGLRMMKKGQGSGEEYLTLQFADKVLLHVPASKIDLIQKYIGGFAGRPPLSKLGGSRWKKQKEQVAESVKDMAAELLRVQAARASMPGISYGPDTDWLRQFEAEFAYTETEDQLASMAEIKKDMADTQPMDRLLCGDVGYGKTELAIRAAFKAIEHGKQVALLCPTTILCEQHGRTFKQRMADYPIKISSLNRFKTGTEVKRTLEGMMSGQVDLVIGTHRLLSDDICFKNLGLVIVDEEQKFGVEHKNKLMRFRVTVDVLTMSATPIPRTLHMSLLGLKNISSLVTPPADRRAVVTEVVPFDNKRIRDAILRELNRGGQCFFLHNRVRSIHTVANDLRALVPEAKFIVGHGQMGSRGLEDVMMKFFSQQADVLVSTTIIESGIDVPTANTIFINDCDRFGLAELHQLRGRVGRYKHRAYCYLLMPKNRPLSEVASRRLRAIEDFSMLGAGFKISMRDMEIRGAGNILGAQQSGHIAAVGYQMYCKLLEQATRELRNETTHEPVRTHLELNFTGHIPRNYIPSDSRRMMAYRRISGAPDLVTLDEIEKDLIEAYGELPKPVETLIELAQIRAGLSAINVKALKLKDKDLIFVTKNMTELYAKLKGVPGSVRLVDPPDKNKIATVYFRPPENYIKIPGTLSAILRKLFVRSLPETVA